MPPQVRELLALMTLAVFGWGFSWMHGDQLLPSIFAAEGLVVEGVALRR
jgi:hypothetical protein